MYRSQKWCGFSCDIITLSSQGLRICLLSKTKQKELTTVMEEFHLDLSREQYETIVETLREYFGRIAAQRNKLSDDFIDYKKQMNEKGIVNLRAIY